MLCKEVTGIFLLTKMFGIAQGQVKALFLLDTAHVHPTKAKFVGSGDYISSHFFATEYNFSYLADRPSYYCG